MPPKMHERDSDCSPYLVDGQCTVCGVSHTNECPSCGGRGFHEPSCPDNDINWKARLPFTDKSTDNPSHDFIEVEPSRVLCNDVILPGEYNPHKVRLWIASAAFSNWPTFLGAVWAGNEQDALDTLIDEGLGDALLVEDEAVLAMSDGERESLAYLGNAGEACDLTNVGLIPVKFSAARDKGLLAMFKKARENGLASLGEL
jgi:hypothetical protein